MGIYLDNAATSYPKPENVAKSVYDFMINNNDSQSITNYKTYFGEKLNINTSKNKYTFKPL